MLMTMTMSPNESIKFIANRGVSMSNTIIEENISKVKCKLGGNIAKKQLFTQMPSFCFYNYDANGKCTMHSTKELAVSNWHFHCIRED